MRLLSIAVLATLPIAFGAPVQTTEVANTKRSESVAAVVKALFDSNRLIVRDGESQSDVLKRGGVTGRGPLSDGWWGSLSAARIGSLLGWLSSSEEGAINKRQLLSGLGDAGNLLGGLLGGGGASAAPPSPALPAPASPPSSGTYGNAPSSGGDPSTANSGSSPPGNGGNGDSWPPSSGGSGGSWPPSSGGPGAGGSGGDWPGSGDPGNGWPATGEPGSGGAGSSGSAGGYTYGGGK